MCGLLATPEDRFSGVRGQQAVKARARRQRGGRAQASRFCTIEAFLTTRSENVISFDATL